MKVNAVFVPLNAVLFRVLHHGRGSESVENYHVNLRVLNGLRAIRRQRRRVAGRRIKGFLLNCVRSFLAVDDFRGSVVVLRGNVLVLASVVVIIGCRSN